MPKRPNPFGDSSPLQFKSHIGTKEVDLGVEKDRKMQLVYEKTRNMLFSGARKTSSLPVPETAGENLCSGPVASDQGRLKFTSCGQLCSEKVVPMVSQEPLLVEKEAKMEVDANANSCYGNNNTIMSLPRGQMQIDKMGQLYKGPFTMSPMR